MANLVQNLETGDTFPQVREKLNESLDALETAAVARGTSLNYGGMQPPVAATAGVDDHNWTVTLAMGEFPPASILAFDHGVALRADQFTYDPATGAIVIDPGYTPGPPIVLTYGYNSSQKHIHPPVLASNIIALGALYFSVPAQAGHNLMVLDNGRFLRQDQWHFEMYLGARVIKVHSAPTSIAVSWGDDTPGMINPIPLVQVNPPLDTIHWFVPAEAEGPVVVFDHGLPLRADQVRFEIDGTLTILGYSPTLPLDMAAAWGYRSDAGFVEKVLLDPLPDGVETSFNLPRYLPMGKTVRIRQMMVAGEATYSREIDFELDGRQVTFTVAPPNEGQLLAEFVTSSLGGGLDADTVDGFHAVPYDAPPLNKIGKLVATGPDGKLPADVVGNADTVDGFHAFPSDAVTAGTPATANMLPATDASGRLDEDVLPASPTLGATILNEVLLRGLVVDINTLTREWTYNINGQPTQMRYKDGLTIVATVDYTYTGTRVNTTVFTTPTQVVTDTYNYDVNNLVSSISRTVT